MEVITTLLNAFGITPERYPFLVLGILIIGGTVYIRYSIGNKLGKIKDNVLIIVTHLSNSASARGRLDTNLIQVMSPMAITPKGHDILVESGFTTIMNTPEKRKEILSHLHKQNPDTKLDVENQAILSFASVLEMECVNPIKGYLYNHPHIREVYTTLAGLLIRDEYLKDHPEIKQ